MKKTTPELLNEIELEIKKHEKEYDYYVKEWDPGTIYDKYSIWLDEDNNEIYVPTYQRELTWSTDRKARFIESIFLNLPIPFIFLNETESRDSRDIYSRLEIVDWSQRIRTIVEFIDDEFSLKGLKILGKLNWLKFSQLQLSRQQKFRRMPIRIVVFRWLSEDRRREIFNRINTSSDLLRGMEIRKGSLQWPFYQLLDELSKTPLFRELSPLSKIKEDREEYTELVLRFFAYTDKFTEYSEKVQKFLDDYMREETEKMLNLYWEIEKKKNEWKIDISEEKEYDDFIKNKKNQFLGMLKFVKDFFPNGFKKEWSKSVTSRVFFESISVWVWLAINEVRGDLSLLHHDHLEIKKLLNSKEYHKIITSDWANNKAKFYDRINVIKDYLLN